MEGCVNTAMSEFIQAPFNKTRKDKFIAVIPAPKGLRDIQSKFRRGNTTILPDSFILSIVGTVAPPVVVPAIANRYSGQTHNVTSYTREPWPPLTFSFTIDNRFNNYWYIYKWLDILNDDQTGIYDNADVTNVRVIETTKSGAQITNFDRAIQYYSTDISLYAVDEYEKRVIEFKYTRAFPTKLGGLDFSYREGDEMAVTVEFAYSQFTASLVDYVESL